MNITRECEQALRNDKERREINDKIILLKAISKTKSIRCGASARVTMDGSIVHIDADAIFALITHYEDRLSELDLQEDEK